MEIEIKPLSKVNAIVQIPGSKSYTNRALVIASLADGISLLEGYLVSEDTELMIKALRRVGIPITSEDRNLTVMGRGGKIGLVSEPIFAGNSGTTLRFLASVLALGHGSYVLDGNDRMRERPIGDLLKAMNLLHIKARGTLQENYPPIVIEANGIKGGKTTLKGESSSQYLSSLLMCAPYAQTPIEIKIEGELVSKPYVDMTLEIMKVFGVEVKNEGYRKFKIKAPQKYSPAYYTIETDASNASYFFAAAAITGGKVRVNHLSTDTHQGDIKILNLLSKMGCMVQKGTDWVELEGKSLQAIEADLKDMPDMVQTLAIVALFAKGQTRIKNIAHLKIKETDRIENLATELRKIGAEVESGDDYLFISAQKLTASSIGTYNDHRMAMSFAVAGLKIPGLKIQDPECVKKSFPAFWDQLETLYL